VVAFGSVDSHDENYFQSPQDMIRGPVADPTLALDNTDIARRHVTAYILQRYIHERLAGITPDANPQLFEVLGKVSDFRDPTKVPSGDDLRRWLREHEGQLQQELWNWLPEELSSVDRNQMIANLATSTIKEIEEAIA
jgi:hypothetical protein